MKITLFRFRARMLFSALLFIPLGLHAQGLPNPVFLDLGPVGQATGSTEVGPAGISGTWQQVDRPAGGTTVLTLTDNQTVELGRGDNNASLNTVLWNGRPAEGTWTPPAGSAIAAEGNAVFGDYLRNGDANRNLGIRLTNFAPGEYLVYMTIRPAGTSTAGRNVGVGLITGGNMGTSSSIANLTQSTVGAWSDFNASLTSWTGTGSSGSPWNVLVAPLTITNSTDYIVGILESTGDNQMGIMSMQIVAIPEPSTYAFIFALVAFGSILLRRRMKKQ